MATKKTESLIVGKFIVVSQRDHPIAHQAWADWRREQFGCDFVPKAYSVPSMFPPSTQAGADAYAEQLQSIRDAVLKEGGGTRGWQPVPRHPSPWGHVSHETVEWTK